MRCPVCGAKMRMGFCPYCNISEKSVRTASNKKAKEAFKLKQKDKVCYSTVWPSDINKTTLILLTIFLGYAGAGYLYIGRKVKGYIFLCINIITLALFTIYSGLIVGHVIVSDKVFSAILDVCTLFLIITLFVWIYDIFGIIFKTYKVPVVLGEDKK